MLVLPHTFSHYFQGRRARRLMLSIDSGKYETDLAASLPLRGNVVPPQSETAYDTIFFANR